MFDPQTGRIILRSEPRILDSFHESYHAEQWLDLGKPDYLTQSMLQREEFVYSTIMKIRISSLKKKYMKHNVTLRDAELENGRQLVGRDMIRNEH